MYLVESKGSHDVTVSNGLVERIRVELTPTDMVRQSQLRNKKVGLGVGMDGIKFEVTFISYHIYLRF